MTTQAYPDTHHDVSSNTIFGFWIYLMTDCIMFATFFAAYAVLFNNTFGGPSGKDLFSLPFALAETIVLLASSFTCGVAMVEAPRNKIGKMVVWFGLTFLLGVVFLWMQMSEFQRFALDGNTWERSAFLSSYYTLIGTHGLHIVVGLILMLVFVAQLLRRGITTVTLRRLTCFRIYWQFLYFIWIFTFAFVYLMGAK